MSQKPNEKPSIFKSLLDAGQATLDAQIMKAKNSIKMNANLDDDFFYAKAVTEEPNYSIHTAGYKEKPTRLQNSHLKQMSIKNTIVAAIIQTRQNQVAAHSGLVESEQKKGFMVKLRDEQALIEEIKIKLREEMDAKAEAAANGDPEAEEEVMKAEGNPEEPETDTDQDVDLATQQEEDKNKDDDDVEEFDWELERKAKEMLRKKFEKDMRIAEQYILNCGKVENRPFDKKRWNFDAALRAWVRDSYTYDFYASEIVPNRIGQPHYWFPVDGGTMKYASVDLKKYKSLSENFIQLDLLYPEKEGDQIQKDKILDLDEEILAKDAYKWVQVVRGKIERAYTDDELKVGIRNLTTDIFNNGYGLSELELAVALITGHLNAEFYNQAYFTQGFSAKGILHIKAGINRRKLETVRQQWQHMIRGARNSFQTPIFAGVNDVQWIPLTQNHDDIGFEGWMRYLIKMTCAIFQIDPHEIGIGFKDEGPSGSGGMSGDNTKEKMEHSKDKGLVPLLRHMENYVNENILRPFDDRFIIEFTGVTAENQKESLDRQEREVKFKKTVNEIRAEDGLPPIPGMDGVMLSQEFLGWYSQFSKEAQDLQEQNMQKQQEMMNANNPQEEEDPFNAEDSMYSDESIDNNIFKPETVSEEGEIQKSRKIKKKKRPLKIEYYKVD